MTIHYVLRGIRGVDPIEREGELTAEQVAGVKANQTGALINLAIRSLHNQGTLANWEECVLTDTTTQQEDTYIFRKKRWTQRPQTHTRN